MQLRAHIVTAISKKEKKVKRTASLGISIRSDTYIKIAKL